MNSLTCSVVHKSQLLGMKLHVILEMDLFKNST